MTTPTQQQGHTSACGLAYVAAIGRAVTAKHIEEARKNCICQARASAPETAAELKRVKAVNAELVNELKRAAKGLEDAINMGIGHGCISTRLDNARAAIAKAEGRG